MNPPVNIHCSNHNNCKKKEGKTTIQDENSVIFAAWGIGTKQERQQFIKYPQEFEGSLVPAAAVPAMPPQSHAARGSRGEHGAALPHPQAHKPHTQHRHFHSLLTTLPSMCCLTLTHSSIFHTKLEQEIGFSRVGMQDCPALAARPWHCCSLCGAVTHST